MGPKYYHSPKKLIIINAIYSMYFKQSNIALINDIIAQAKKNTTKKYSRNK